MSSSRMSPLLRYCPRARRIASNIANLPMQCGPEKEEAPGITGASIDQLVLGLMQGLRGLVPGVRG